MSKTQILSLNPYDFMGKTKTDRGKDIRRLSACVWMIGIMLQQILLRQQSWCNR